MRRWEDRSLLYVLAGRGDVETVLLAYDADELAADETTLPLWTTTIPDCPSVIPTDGVGVSLWTMQGIDHIPSLLPAYKDEVMAWLNAHARQ